LARHTEIVNQYAIESGDPTMLFCPSSYHLSPSQYLLDNFYLVKEGTVITPYCN
jgi:hypothetical protein